MNILVCISKTPDTTSKISFVDDNTKFNPDGVSFIMNPYDEWYALVKAIELKEKLGGTVQVVSVGKSDYDIVIRKALAIGADSAVRIDVDATNSLQVAKQIAAYAKGVEFDAIYTGKETIDFNGGEVGAMIAELLEIPYFANVSKLDQDGSTVKIQRDIEGGIEMVQSSGKYVISAAKGVAEQRIPNMRGIMMAKRKPLEVVSGISVEDKVTLTSFEMPEAKSGIKMVNSEDMDELVRLLHEEAKVI